MLRVAILATLAVLFVLIGPTRQVAALDRPMLSYSLQDVRPDTAQVASSDSTRPAVSDTTITAAKVFRAAGGLRWWIVGVGIIGLLIAVWKALGLFYDRHHAASLYDLDIPTLRGNVKALRDVLDGEQLKDERSFLRRFINKGVDLPYEFLINLREMARVVWRSFLHLFKSGSPAKKHELPPPITGTLIYGVLDTIEKTLRHGNPDALYGEIDYYIRFQRDRFETFKVWMRVCSDVAGGLGLLGTVWGMYTVFNSGELEKQVILGGMGVALITTLLGLGVSLLLDPVTALINAWFNRRIELVASQADRFRFSLVNPRGEYQITHSPRVQDGSPTATRV